MRYYENNIFFYLKTFIINFLRRNAMKYLKKTHNRFNFFTIVTNIVILTSGLFLLDYYNIITMLLSNNYIETIVKIFLIVSSITIVIEVIKRRLWNTFFLPSILNFDKYIIVLFFTELLCLSSLFTISSYNRVIVLVISIINLLIIVVRVISYNVIINSNRTKISNVYDISELYHGTITDENGLILLEEEPIVSSKNDLLNYDIFVNGLKDSLLLCKPKKTFVISLIGKWGSGKTSVINLLKEKVNNNDNSIIEMFSPWKYDNKLSLFKGFYNYIFKLIGKNYSYYNYRNLLKKYENVIFNAIKNKTDIDFLSFIEADDEEEIDDIKKQINDIIGISDKKIIIVIDDIDRLDKNEILFVFKMVKNIFDFNNIIYILCYDEERINRIFENELKVDSNYLNKIVQDKVYIPIKEKKKMIEIGATCLNNLSCINKIQIKDEKRHFDVIDCVFSQFEDLREIIRFLNSISISMNFLKTMNLDFADFIVLEYIKFKDITLYNSIYNNAKFFLSQDSNFHNEYELLFEDKYNIEAKEYFDKEFTSKTDIKKLLAYSFPNIKRYNENRPIRSSGYYFENNRNSSIVDRRIFNGRFFKCYFILNHSFFTELDKLMNNFVNNVNKGDDVEKEFKTLISEINPDNHDLLFELMNIKINSIDNKPPIFVCILAHIDDFENKGRFFQLNSFERAKVMLSSIIKNESSKEQQQEYINTLADKSVFLLEKIIYWLKSDKYNISQQLQEIIDYAQSILNKKLKKYYSTRKNILELKNAKNIVWILYRNSDDKEAFKKYIMSMVNEKNVYKFLGLFITTYIGEKESYAFYNDSLLLLTSQEKVDKIIKKVKYNLNPNQKKVKYLYDNYDKDVREYEAINYELL